MASYNAHNPEKVELKNFKTDATENIMQGDTWKSSPILVSMAIRVALVTDEQQMLCYIC